MSLYIVSQLGDPPSRRFIWLISETPRNILVRSMIVEVDALPVTQDTLVTGVTIDVS
jgi:hypothetical protein